MWHRGAPWSTTLSPRGTAASESVGDGKSALLRDLPAQGVEAPSRNVPVVDGDGDDRLSRDQLQRLDLGRERMEGKAGKAVVLLPRGGVLKDDAVRPRRCQNFEPSGIRRIQEAPLPLDEN